MNFGEKLRLLRTERVWNQPELAEKLGIEQSYLSKLENGHSLPSGEIVDNVLNAFEISVDELLRDIDPAIVKKQLSGIPRIANHLSESNARENGNRSRWLIAACLSIAAGFSLIIVGALQLRYPVESYQYVSDGIVPMGANGEVFTTLEEYVDYAVAPMQLEWIDADISSSEFSERTITEKYRVSYTLAPLAFHDFLSSPVYRGHLFTEEMTAVADWDILVAAGVNTGGTRTYTYEGSEELYDPTPVWLVSAGFFLAFWGMLAFAIAGTIFKKAD